MTDAKAKPIRLSIFRQRRNSFLLYFGIIAALTVGSSLLTEFDWLASVTSFPKAFGWLFGNAVPTEAAIKVLPSILLKLWQTVLISIMSTVIAAILAFGLALIGARPNVAGGWRVWRCTRPNAFATR